MKWKKTVLIEVELEVEVEVLLEVIEEEVSREFSVEVISDASEEDPTIRGEEEGLSIRIESPNTNEEEE